MQAISDRRRAAWLGTCCKAPVSCPQPSAAFEELFGFPKGCYPAWQGVGLLMHRRDGQGMRTFLTKPVPTRYSAKQLHAQRAPALCLLSSLCCHEAAAARVGGRRRTLSWRDCRVSAACHAAQPPPCAQPPNHQAQPAKAWRWRHFTPWNRGGFVSVRGMKLSKKKK